MRLPQLSLLSRVALALAAVGLLPLAISSFGLVDMNRDAMVDQVLRTHLVAAQSAAVQVAAFVSTRVSLARGAASNPALADPRSPVARNFLAENLGAWADLGVLAVEVTDPRGERVIQAQLRGVQDRVSRALSPDVRLPLAVIPAAPGRDLTFRLTAPLPQGVGLLRLVCDGSTLRGLAALDALGAESDLVVAERSGRVLLGTASDLARYPAGLVKNALSGLISGAGRFGAPDGEEILGAYSPVPDSDWVVVSRQPARVAEAVAIRLRRRSLYAIAAAAALIAALSVFAWKGIVRPLRDLVEGQRRLARLPSAELKSGDEIGDLRRAFEALERSLADRSLLDNVFLGRYQVVEPLGTGAMGSVFRGWDPKLQRPVALKTVRLDPGSAELGKRRQLMETLLREAVTLARLSHPHVVPVFDLEDSPEGAFIAMGLVDGINLETLMWERGGLGAHRVVPLGAAIARALEAAHANGVVHRDIKPANVLLGWDGSIKVSDFGIAELLAAAEGDGSGKVIVGTPGYVPPETLERGDYGRAGDLFALGVVLYRALRGVHPFAGGTPHEIVRATMMRTVPSLARSVPDLPADLDRLVLHLLEKDEAARPADAGAVAAELESLAAANGYRWALDLRREDLQPPPAANLAQRSTQRIPRSRRDGTIPVTRPER
ncbi:MAG: protein kinase [Acidobacteriota bacterium]